ncbi:hypothetical protein NKW54_05465 [Acetobacter cerevisiae]|uniref:Uncharacterized protein n=1 Tax=Acetobacter cerevisiae TaxID=178900 RepID=A0ABT1EPT4_9PROT|nr:hypothetical protein [Acetobacter cerevisiae]MCP1245389.1 hypothetical protein [Acetobacter cerevisiae]MCP1254965.1 hypothetical protein [Acetobacter cerevisiae]
MTTTQPKGAYVPLPINLGMREAIEDYQGGVTDTDEFLLAIGTPYAGGELEVTGLRPHFPFCCGWGQQAHCQGHP